MKGGRKLERVEGRLGKSRRVVIRSSRQLNRAINKLESAEWRKRTCKGRRVVRDDGRQLVRTENTHQNVLVIQQINQEWKTSY